MRVAVCAVLGPWATPDLDQGESPVKNPRLSMRQLEATTDLLGAPTRMRFLDPLNSWNPVGALVNSMTDG